MMSLFNLALVLAFVVLSSVAAIILKQTEKKNLLVLWTLVFMYLFTHIGFVMIHMYEGHTLQ